MHNDRRRIGALLLTAALGGCATTAIADLRHATLIVIDENMSFRARLSEPQLARLGCTYATQDPAALRALQRLLDTTSFDPAQDDDARQFEPRYALYRDKADGTASTLLLGRRFNNRPQRAGMLDGKPVSVAISLAPDLVQWAADAGIPQSNPHCVNAAHI